MRLNGLQDYVDKMRQILMTYNPISAPLKTVEDVFATYKSMLTSGEKPTPEQAQIMVQTGNFLNTAGMPVTSQQKNYTPLIVGGIVLFLIIKSGKRYG